jgi:TetR/AcrR family transcriptional regulator, acrEF/envCD operon repressor
MARVPVAQRRWQLIEATIALLAREGVGAASIRRISEEADVPLGLVHYCFTSKQELIAETIRQLNTENTTAARAALSVPAGAGTDLRSALTAAFRAYWSLVERSPRRQLLTYELNAYALRDKELAPIAEKAHREQLNSVRDLLDEIATATGRRWTVPLDDVARLVVTVTGGATLNWLNDRDSAAAQTTADLVVGALDALAT